MLGKRPPHLDNCIRRTRSKKDQIISVQSGEKSLEGKQKIGLRREIDVKSSEEEHRVDARAPYAEEGRGKLRKATRSRKQALIRRYPNGGTRLE